MGRKSRPSPAFRLYADEWLGSRRIKLMTLEERGAYIQLLAHMWNSPYCRLRDDDKELATLSDLGRKWYRGSGARLRKCFVKTGNQHGKWLTSSRLRAVWVDQHDFKRKKREAGMKSGIVRREKDLQTNTARTQLEHSSNTTRTQGEPSSSTSSSKKRKSTPPTPSKKEKDKETLFEGIPYEHSPAMRDKDYKNVVEMWRNAQSDGRQLTNDEHLLVNVALVWPHYAAKCPFGSGFRGSEKTIAGYLVDGITIKEMQKQADNWPGTQRAAVFEVFDVFEKKAEHRRASQEQQRKINADRERQRQRRQADRDIMKENDELRQAWEREHPGQKFPGFVSEEFQRWRDPEVTNEEIQAFKKIFPEGGNG